MRQALIYGGLGVVALLAVLWLVGGLDAVAGWLQAAQRATQDRLAAAIRALRGGEPGALVVFWAVCFGYGVLHAAGPGHGKLLIGGYGVARRVPLVPLAGLALVSSLAQAAVAVALVYAVVAVLGLSRLAVEGAAEAWLAPASHAMIAGLGLWLAWRGACGVQRLRLTDTRGHSGHDHHNPHAHDHSHDDNHGHEHCATCGHAHGPTLEQVSSLTGWRDAMVLVAGIAMRPCSGALFVLILTWQLGIALAGVVGAFAMGLGTALVTTGVAALAVWAREGALAGLGAGKGGARMARALPVIELTAGGVIAAAAFGLLKQSL
jgi:nickel/cobalt transporter (NicO) family protein